MTPRNVVLSGTAKTVASRARLAGFDVVSTRNELGVGVAGRRKAQRGLVEFRAIWPAKRDDRATAEPAYVHVWFVGWHTFLIGPTALNAELARLVSPAEP